MNARSLSILAVSIALIGATAVFIHYRRTHQRLGTPGVKVVAVPIHDPDGNLAGTNSVSLPDKVLDYKSEVEPVARIVLEWLPQDTTYGQRRYKAPDGFEIAFSAILMGADRTSIHKPKYCLNGSGWQIIEDTPDSVTVSRPHTYELPIRRMAVRRDVKLPSGQVVTQHGWYVYWFASANQLTADHNQRMWWMTLDLVRTGVLQRWAYMACLTVCPPGQDEKTYERIKDFIAEAVPHFQLTHGPETRLAKAENP